MYAQGDNLEVIEELLSRSGLSPSATQFILALKAWVRQKPLTAKQSSALRYIKLTYDKQSSNMTEDNSHWDKEGREKASVCANYYIENPPYFSDLAHRVLGDPSFIPSKREFEKLINNKYSEKVLNSHYSKPRYEKGDLVTIRVPAKYLYDCELEAPMLVLQANAAPVISAAKDSKRYLVLPVGEEIPLLIEERHIKIYKRKA